MIIDAWKINVFNAFYSILYIGNGDTSWCFSQVKGTLEDDVTEADIVSCVEFNHDGELLATGDKGGRVVIFQVSAIKYDGQRIITRLLIDRYKNLF